MVTKIIILVLLLNAIFTEYRLQKIGEGMSILVKLCTDFVDGFSDMVDKLRKEVDQRTNDILNEKNEDKNTYNEN